MKDRETYLLKNFAVEEESDQGRKPIDLLLVKKKGTLKGRGRVCKLFRKRVEKHVGDCTG